MDSRRWDAFAAAFFLLVLLTSAARLSATGWAEALELAAPLALLGALLGLALGVSRFCFWLAAVAAGGYTIFVFPWALGISQYPALDWTGRLLALWQRWQEAFATLAARQPLEDTFLFLGLVSLTYWLIGLSGGFFLARRGDFVVAVFPSGLALLLVQAFDRRHPGGGVYLFLYLFAGLLLVARLYFLNRRADWRQARVHVPVGAKHDWNLAVLLSVILTLGLAWIMPTPTRAVGFVQRAWQRLTPRRENRETAFSRLIAGLQTENRAAPYVGDVLTLEQDAANDPSVVFTVELPPVDHAPRYYWRARVYDFYEDGQWATRNVLIRHFSPAEAPLSLPEAHGTPATYTFTLQMPANWLFTPPRTRWINLPLRVGMAQAAPLGNGTAFLSGHAQRRARVSGAGAGFLSYRGAVARCRPGLPCLGWRTIPASAARPFSSRARAGWRTDR